MSFSEMKVSQVSRMIATRQNSAEFYSSLMRYLPDPDPVLRKNGQDVKVYHEIMQDPHVFSCMEQRKAKTLSMEWELNRGGSKSRNAKFIQGILDDDDFNLFSLMEQMLDSIAYGFTPLEIYWETVGNYYVPVKVIGKPVEWFLFDDFNVMKFRSKAQPVYGEELPDRKFLCAQHKSTYYNPYGERVLSRCFWPVTFKKAPEKWWIRFLEKYGSIFPVGKLPRNLMGEGSTEQEKLLDLLENLIEDGVAVIPDDSSVELQESANKSATTGIYKERCEYSNTEISKAILTQTLTTEIQGKGSYAASNTHSDMLTHLALKDKRIIEQEMNKLISWIYELNFTDTDYPRFTMYLPEDVDKDLADRDRQLKDIGVKFNKEYFVNNYNLSPEEFDIAEEAPIVSEPAQTSNSKNIDVPGTGTASNISDDFSEKTTKGKNIWQRIIQLFSENDQEEKPSVDVLTNSIPDEVLQQQMEKLLKPVFDMIKSGSSMKEVNNKLAELYPDMDTKDLETLLAKMFFISNLAGVMSAE
jgi:phage gp29-like protein